MVPKRRAKRPPLEVVSQVDGAWYDGDVSLQGSRLQVHFDGFGHEVDEFWEEEFLKSPTRVKEIVRLRSIQLQDSQCATVKVGMIVCANFKSTNGMESKYYDAEVLMIYHNHRPFRKSEKKQKCNCRFKLVWKAGPSMHNEVYLGCADISFIDVDDVRKHPVVDQVLQVAFDYVLQSESENVLQPEQILTIQYDQMELEQVSTPKDSKEYETIQEQVEQDLSIENIILQVQTEPVHSIVEEQIRFEEILHTEDIQRHCVDPLYDGLPSEDADENLFTSMDLDGLSDEIIHKMKNYNTFHEFLGKEANKLKEAIDVYNFKHNINLQN